MRTKSLSSQLAKRIWQFLFWLSPLAFLGGLLLYRQHNAEMQVPFQLDRFQTIARAREFAASKGIEAANWEAITKPEERNTLYFYYRFKGEAVAAPLRRANSPSPARSRVPDTARTSA